jgi:hypothetical protein
VNPQLTLAGLAGKPLTGPARVRRAVHGGDEMKAELRMYAVAVSLGACSLMPITAMTHHANSAYDRDQSVTVTGTVVQWQFINPHSGLWLDVTDDSGNVVRWSGEFQGTLDLYRHFSWNKETFKPGDQITLVGSPSRDGSPNLSTRLVIFADGIEVDVRSAPD